MRREILTWQDVDALLEHLIPQFEVDFDAMLLITKGGIIPGGLVAEALNISQILTAAVDFPADKEIKIQKGDKARWLSWPKFMQFPDRNLIENKNILIVDDVWGSGRTITAVKNSIASANGYPYTCVMHFNPYRNMFENSKPDYYAAVTDAYIVYPWEIDHGTEKVLLDDYDFDS